MNTEKNGFDHLHKVKQQPQFFFQYIFLIKKPMTASMLDRVIAAP